MKAPGQHDHESPARPESGTGVVITFHPGTERGNRCPPIDFGQACELSATGGAPSGEAFTSLVVGRALSLDAVRRAHR